MNKTFKQLSGDDGTIDIKEFTIMLDEWVDTHMSKSKLSGLDEDHDEQKSIDHK
jgi:hypothetical protein